MLDTAIGPITHIVDGATFQMQVTHIGRHNKFRYNNYETVHVALNRTAYPIYRLVNVRVKCSVQYRDVYTRLYADLDLEG